MVKNLPTVERSTKIRFGKNCTDDQAENTIVFNASNVQIDPSIPGAVYMTPLREQPDLFDTNVTIMSYNTSSKEVMDTGVTASKILNFNLEDVTINGNVTSNTMIFRGETAFITESTKTGISNSAPTHTLDVGSNLYVDDTGDTILDVTGTTKTSELRVTGDARVSGNLEVTGVVTSIRTENVVMDDAIIELANNNTLGTTDMGVIMTKPGTNVGLGYRGHENEFMVGFTQSDASGLDLVPDTSNLIQMKVYGDLDVSNTLDVSTRATVGSNVVIDDDVDNVIHVTGNTYTSRAVNVGSNVVIDDLAEDVIVATGNVAVSHALDVGSNVMIDDLAEDVIVATGNVAISHALDVGSNVVIDDLAEDVIVATGNVAVSHALDVGSNVVIDDLAEDVIVATGNVAVSHALDVGSNVVIDDLAEDVIVATGNVAVSHALDVGSNVVIDDLAEDVIVATGNVAVSHALDIGSNVVIDDLAEDVIVATGNVAVSHGLDVGSNVVIDDLAEDVIAVTGNIYTSQILSVGSNVVIDDLAEDVIVATGNVAVSHALDVGSNVVIDDLAEDVIVATGNVAVSRGLDVGSNVVIDDLAEDVIVATGNVAVSHALDVGSNVVIDDLAEDVIVATGNVVVSHALDVGSNVVIDDLAEDVIVATGNVAVSRGLDVGSNVVIDDLAEDVIVATGNVAVSHALDVGSNVVIDDLAEDVIVATGNVTVSHALDVGSNVVIDDLAEDVIVATGNVAVSRALDVGSNVVIDDLAEDVIVATGNTHTTRKSTVGSNVTIDTLASDKISVEGNIHTSRKLTVGPNVVVDTLRSNVVSVTGGMYASDHIHVGSNVLIDEFNEDVIIATGNVSVSHALDVGSNVVIDDLAEDVIVATGNVAVSRGLDVGSNVVIDDLAEDVIVATGNVAVSRGLDVGSNVVIDDLAEDVIAVTGNVSVSHALDVGSNVVIDDLAEDVIAVTGNVSVSHALDVGSNVVIDDLAEDVIAATGNVAVSRGLDVGSNVVIDDLAEDVIVATGNVAVSHALDVGSNVVIDDLAEDVIVATGNVAVSRGLDVGSNVVIDDLAEDVIVATGNVSVSRGLDVGSNITINDLAIDAIDVTGNVRVSQTLTAEGVTSNTVNANTYYGDGGILSNVTLQVVSDKGNATSNTIQFTNPTTAFTTNLTSNVEVKLDQLSNVNLASLSEDQLLVYDGSNWVNDYSVHNFVKIKNNTGATLLKGQSVYVKDGWNANVSNVALAKSDSSSTMPSIGVVHDDVLDGGEGVAVAYGKIQNIDTRNFPVGQTVYVSNTVAGGLMGTKPYGLNDKIQNVGICLIQSTQQQPDKGTIFVTGVGRSNDIPNAPVSSSPNYVYVNETNNDLKKIAPENLLTKLQTLEQVVNTGNTVSNSIQITGNLTVSENVSIGGLTSSYVPFVGTDNYLQDSSIRKDNGNIVISADTQITGDLTVTGNSYVISSNNVVIEDRILGLANNNTNHDLDTGIIMEHPGHNIALIHHGDEDRFSMGYTQNTLTDDHVLGDSNIFLLNVLGNVDVQNTITIQQNAYFNGNVGISNTAPGHDLSVGSNIYVDDDGTHVVNVTGNIAATRFIGDGAYLTNIASNLEQIVLNGNTTSRTVHFENAISVVTTGAVGIANSAPEHDLSIGSNLYMDDTGSNVVHVEGNVYATRFIGDGSFLENIASNLEQIVLNGNATSRTVQFENATSIVTTGNVGISNSAPEHDLSVGSNLYMDDTGSNVIHVEGNVYATRFIGDGSFLENIASNLEQIVLNGNATSRTVHFENTISVVTTGAVGISNSAPEHDLSVGSNIYVDDDGSNVVHVEGNVYATRFIGDGSFLENIASNLEQIVLNGNATSRTVEFKNATSIVTTGNVGISNSAPEHDLSVGSNIYVDDDGSNVVHVEGNVYATRFIGDGSFLENIASNLEQIVLNGNATSRTVEFKNATSIVTTGNVGIANTAPDHELSVGSNLYVDDVGSNVLVINGNTYMGALTLGFGEATIQPSYGLHHVTEAYNQTPDTIILTNATTGLDVTSNIEIGGNLKFDSNVLIPNMRIADFATNVVTYDAVTGEFTDSGGLISNKFAIVSEQPPSALTGASTVIEQHGTYSVDQSIGTGQNVFDKSTGTWASEADYTGTDNVYDGVTEHHLGSLLGDWIQLTLPYKAKLRHISLLPAVSTDSFPTAGHLYASNDGSTWTDIKSWSGLTPSSLTDTQRIAVDASVAYKQYVLVATQTVGATTVNIGEWKLFAESFAIDGGIMNTTAQISLDNGIQSNLEVGTANLFVDTTSGNVGVGTTTPGYPLDVHGTANVGSLTASGIYGPIVGSNTIAASTVSATTVGTHYGTIAGSNAIAASTGTFSDDFEVGTANLFVDVSTGGVGVSNSAPTHTLDVGSNLYVEDTGTSVLTVLGNAVVSNKLTVQSFRISSSSSSGLQAVTTGVGANTTSNPIVITNAVNSTSTTTGALTLTNGGLGVTGDIHAGGTLTLASDLAVDGSTFNVDAAQNRVGILTSSPQYPLDVHGAANVGALTTTSVSGDGSGITNMNADNISSGTLDNARLPSSINVTNLSGDGSGITNILSSSVNDFSSNVSRIAALESGDLTIGGEKTFSSNLEVGTANLFVDTTTGNVGVGTTQPTESLDIVGNLNLQKVSNTATIQLNSNVVTEYTRSKKSLIKYPRVALGTNSTSYSGLSGGSTVNGYTIKASDEYSSNFVTSKAFTNTRLDDYDTWISSASAYNSTTRLPVTNSATTTKFGQDGSWLEIKLPNAIQLHYIHVFSRNTHITERIDTADIWASNTGTDGDWVKLTTISFNADYTDTNPMVGNIDTSTYYQYFAIQITKNGWAGTYTNVGEWELYGVPEYDPDAHGTDVIMRSVPNVPNTDWLEVYYDGQDYTSMPSTVTDKSGNSVTGTPNGGVGFDTEYKAFTFDGADDYINGTLSNPSGNWTYSTSLWMYPEDLSATNEWLYWIGTEDTGGGAGLQFTSTSLKGTVRNGSSHNVSHGLSSSKWVHVAVVYSAERFGIYLNGIKLSGTEVIDTDLLNLPQNTTLYVGARQTASLYFTGKIANFRLFNRALTGDEVWQLYAYQKEYFDVSPDVVTFKGGRLGIGTSEPRAVLDVKGTVNAETFYGLNDATVAYKFFDTDTTLYTFSGLNLRVGEAYKIIWHYHNTTPNHHVHMFVNGDETDSNYWHAIQQISSSFASGNTAKMFSTGNSSDHIWVYDLRLSHDRRPMMMGHGHFSTPTSGMSTSANQPWRLGTWYHNNQTSAITSLKFDPTSSGAFGAGSYIRILKMM
jgi:hypothetical protein